MIDLSSPCYIKVQASGQTTEDLEIALIEVCKQVSEGFTSGMGNNDSGGFSYEMKPDHQLPEGIVIKDDELDGLLLVVMSEATRAALNNNPNHAHLCYRLRQRIEARLHSIQT